MTREGLGLPFVFRAAAWMSGVWSILYIVAASAIFGNIDSLSSNEDALFSPRSLKILCLSSLVMGGLLALATASLLRRSKVARVCILLFWVGLQFQVIFVESSERVSLDARDFGPALLLAATASNLYWAEDSRAFFGVRGRRPDAEEGS